LIDPSLLRADNFEGFMEDRQKQLLALIEQAMGKAAYSGTVADEGEEIEGDEDAVEAISPFGGKIGIICRLLKVEHAGRDRQPGVETVDSEAMKTQISARRLCSWKHGIAFSLFRASQRAGGRLSPSGPTVSRLLGFGGKTAAPTLI